MEIDIKTEILDNNVNDVEKSQETFVIEEIKTEDYKFIFNSVGSEAINEESQDKTQELELKPPRPSLLALRQALQKRKSSISEVSSYMKKHPRAKRIYKLPMLEWPRPFKRSFQCLRCLYKAENNEELQRHRESHKLKPDTRPAVVPETKVIRKCMFCSFQTESDSESVEELDQHIKGSHKIKVHSSILEDAILKKGNRRRRAPIKSSISQIIFKCVSCNFLTSEESILNGHDCNKEILMIPMKCGLCSYSSLIKKDFIKHLDSHMLKTTCDYPGCDYKSTSKRDYEKHLKLHEGNEPGFVYKCQSCLFETNEGNSIAQHIKSHLESQGGGCLQCTICFQKFRKVEIFVEHITHAH